MSHHVRPRCDTRLWLALTCILAGASTPAAAQDSPAETLKARGLKQVGSTYVLPAEGEIQKKIAELRTLQTSWSRSPAAAPRSRPRPPTNRPRCARCSRQRVEINQQITAFEQQIRGLGVGNFAEAAQRNELIARRNEAVNVYNGLGDRVRLIQSGPVGDPATRDRLGAELSRRREGFIQAVLDLRQIVNAAQKSYAELAADDSVKEAIAAVGRTSKTKPQLGPSPQFAPNIKLLERIEQSVMSDAVTLNKHGGVFWVNATFNGKVVRPMVFDTGARLTTIPASLAEEIGLKPARPTRSSGARPPTARSSRPGR